MSANVIPELEKARFKYIIGYPSLAAFVASDRDRTTLIFKRFDRLAARNLLHLQSELAELQEQQDRLDFAQLDQSMESKQCSRNWRDFHNTAKTDSVQRERLELSRKIQTTLKEYREALLLESTLASLPQPTRPTLQAFRRHYFNGSPSDERGFPTLGGSSSTLYDDANDLVALRHTEHPDRLTAFAQDHLAFLFQTGQSSDRLAYASDTSIQRFVSWIGVIVAAVLLVGAIISLYWVQSSNKRLAMISGYTALFAAAVALLSNARRAELFAATAAYAAVLVVFVSGNLGSCSGAG